MDGKYTKKEITENLCDRYMAETGKRGIECLTFHQYPYFTEAYVRWLEDQVFNLKEHLLVDATPDRSLPVRILQAYIDGSKYCTDSAGNCDDELFRLLNEMNEKRNGILRGAIQYLLRCESDQ